MIRLHDKDKGTLATIVFFMSVVAVFLIYSLSIPQPAVGKEEAAALEKIRTKYTRLPTQPMAFDCQPITNTVIMLYGNQWVLLMKPNGEAVDCNEFHELNKVVSDVKQ
jgi:hypothetical protein